MQIAQALAIEKIAAVVRALLAIMISSDNLLDDQRE
jgi:hypothetical protein